MAHKVCLVVDREFGERLTPLAQEAYLWVVASAVNTPIVRHLCAAKSTGESDGRAGWSITTFEAPADEAPEDTCIGIAELIDDHHNEYSPEPQWGEIEVFGVQLSARVRRAFSGFGNVAFEQTPDGFVCRRGKSG